MARIDQIDGIERALFKIVKDFDVHSHHHRDGQVLARRVRARDDASFGAAFRLVLPGVAGPRAVSNTRALQAMERAAGVLRLLMDPVLPDVALRPTQEPLLLVLTACARELRIEGAAAGGGFAGAATAMANSIDNYVQEARNHPLFSTYDALKDAVDSLLRRVRALLGTPYTVSHDDDDDDEEAEAAEA